MNKYAGLLRIKALLDAYLAALSDEGDQAITDAVEEFFGAHREVLAIAWFQGSGLSHLTFELDGGARYVASEDRIVGPSAPDDAFDTPSYSALADVLWASIDTLVARLGVDCTVRATREGVRALPIAA